MKVNELELIEGCRQGDNSSRRQLYELYSPRMMAICYRYTGDKSLSQDLLHDGFIKVFESADSFRYLGNGSLQAWISRIFTNLLLDFLRKDSKRDNAVSLDDFREEDSVSETDDFEPVPNDVLMRFISELPTGYRTVFNLYVFEEMSHKEISRIMGINESSSRSQLTRAKMILTKKIKKYTLEHG